METNSDKYVLVSVSYTYTDTLYESIVQNLVVPGHIVEQQSTRIVQFFKQAWNFAQG